MSFLFLYYAYE